MTQLGKLIDPWAFVRFLTLYKKHYISPFTLWGYGSLRTSPSLSVTVSPILSSLKPAFFVSCYIDHDQLLLSLPVFWVPCPWLAWCCWYLVCTECHPTIPVSSLDQESHFLLSCCLPYVLVSDGIWPINF